MLHMNYSRILPYLVPAGGKNALAPAWQIAGKKLIFDQFAFAPIITSGFFLVINILEGNGLSKGFQDMQSKIWKTMLVNWQLWIPANFINFLIVPIPYQVLWANFVSIGFNVCLSYIHNNSK